MFHAKVKGKNLQFLEELGDDIPREMLLDEEKVRQVLINLVGNAVKFTKEGYIKIYAGIMQGSKREDKIDLVMAVEDTGIGINEKDQPHIFEAFVQQGDPNLKRFEGAGLGLSICRKLIDLMEGQILVKSTVGVGSVFTVILPGVEIPQNRPGGNIISSAEDLDTIRFEPSTVLIADDHISNLSLLDVVLKKGGLSVTQAHNGQEVLDEIDNCKPDLILLDINMPVMDGLETVKRLKADKNTEAIPVIALSGHPETLRTEEYSSLFNGVLIKPVSIPQVLKEVARFISFSFERNENDLSEKRNKDIPMDYTEEVRAELLKEVLPVLEGTQSALVMKDVFQIAEKIKAVGLEHHSDNLIQMGDRIFRYVQNFEVDRMELILRNFYDYLKKGSSEEKE